MGNTLLIAIFGLWLHLLHTNAFHKDVSIRAAKLPIHTFTKLSSRTKKAPDYHLLTKELFYLCWKTFLSDASFIRTKNFCHLLSKQNFLS
jgi:hypothetical protein